MFAHIGHICRDPHISHISDRHRGRHQDCSHASHRFASAHSSSFPIGFHVGVDKNLGKGPCRGIVVAKEIPIGISDLNHFLAHRTPLLPSTQRFVTRAGPARSAESLPLVFAGLTSSACCGVAGSWFCPPLPAAFDQGGTVGASERPKPIREIAISEFKAKCQEPWTNNMVNKDP